MNINSVKDLETLIKMLRKNGVEAVKIDGLELVLGRQPETVKRTKAPKESFSIGGIDETTKIDVNVQVPEDTLSDEALLFWSATGGEQTPEAI